MINAGDLVMLNQRGRVFYAKVTADPVLGRFAIVPIERDVYARSAQTREVREVWKRQPQAADPLASGQLQLVAEPTAPRLDGRP